MTKRYVSKFNIVANAIMEISIPWKSSRRAKLIKIGQKSNHKPKKIQGYCDRNGMKNFYSGLKGIYDSSSSGSTALFSADGSTLITDKDKVLE